MKSVTVTLSALLLLTLAFFTTSCDKDKDLPPPVLERSYLHINSLSELTDSFDITFDYWNVDDVVISNFFMNRNWPISGYANLLEGGQPDEFGNGKLWVSATQHLFVGDSTDTLINAMAIVLDPGVKSTMFVGDSAGKMFFLLAKDEYTTASNINSVRFVNLCPAPTAAKASLRSTDGTINIPLTNFGTASSFVNYASGVYDFEVVDDLGTVIANAPGVTLWNNGATTFTLSRVSPTLNFYLH